MSIKAIIGKGIEKHLEGHIELHRANIQVYMENSVGIGEHPQHLDEIDKLINKIAEAEDKLKVLKEFN